MEVDNSPIKLASSGFSISFLLISLTLLGSWPFFGDTVVIIGETPSDQSLTHKLPDTLTYGKT